MSRLTAFGRALVPDRAIDRPHLRVMLVLVLLSVFATTGVAALSSPISASVYQYDLTAYVYDAGETVAIDLRSPAASTIDPTAEIGRDPAQMPEPAVEAVATLLDLVAPRAGAVVDDLGRQVSGFGGSIDNIAVSDAVRIQNAADRIGQPISVVGSRARGTAGAYSDWDYVITGVNSRTRHSVSSSLPTGPRGLGEPRNIDIFSGPLNTDEAFVTFYPSSAG